jgi:hypothetical protein
MGKVLTYTLEGDPSRRFMELRMRAVEDHLVFDGNEHEGEFCKQYPHSCMMLRGLYSLDDGMLSIYVTDVPEGQTMKSVEDWFGEIVKTSRGKG